MRQMEGKIVLLYVRLMVCVLCIIVSSCMGVCAHVTFCMLIILCALIFLLKVNAINRDFSLAPCVLSTQAYLIPYAQAFNTILQGLSDPSLHPGRKHSLHHRAVRICRSQKWADKLEQLPNMEVQPFPEVRKYQLAARGQNFRRHLLIN